MGVGVNLWQHAALVDGPATDEFEKLVAERAGRKFAVACNSGTSAIELMLRASLKPCTFVLTERFTFVGTHNGIRRAGMPTDPCHRLLDELETKGANAVLLVHLFGKRHPDTDAIVQQCEEQSVPLFEDSCQAFCVPGATTNGKAAALSFAWNKLITCAGQGGAVVTDDAELAEYVRQLRNQKGDGASNRRMTEAQAKWGVGEFKQLDLTIRTRQRLQWRYVRGLNDLPLLEPTMTTIPLAMLIDCARTEHQQNVCAFLKAADIQHRVPYGHPTYLQLPLHPGMIDDDVDRVCEAVRGDAYRGALVPWAPRTAGCAQ